MESATASQAKIWLDSYDEGMPTTIDCPPVPLDRLLADSAARYPQAPAIMFGARVGTRLMDSTMSYQELDGAVDHFASALQQLSVEQGDRVAIISPNCPQFVISYYGIMRAGGIAVPCNFLYTADELQHQLNDAGAKAAVVLSPFYERIHSIHLYFLNPIFSATSRKHWRHRLMPYRLMRPCLVPHLTHPRLPLP